MFQTAFAPKMHQFAPMLSPTLNDGTVMGLPEKAAPDMVKNFIKQISNPLVFSPTIYLAPEIKYG